MRWRVTNSAIRLSGTALRAFFVEVADDGRATLVVDGEPLATFTSVADLRATFALQDDDLELAGD
jgi:hypothetical protein